MIAQIVLVFISLFAQLSSTPVLDGKTVTNLNEFPFIVRLIIIIKGDRPNTMTESFCVGSIVNPSVILTAAHCVYDAENKIDKITVIAGRKDFRVPGYQQVRLVKAYKAHEDYKLLEENFFTRNIYQPNDIAILWLNNPLGLNKFVQVAEFPKEKIDVGNIIGTSAGWGIQECGEISEVLKKVNLKGITKKDCVQKHNFDISEKSFCAASLNSKSVVTGGDSGCPFIYNNRVLGLLSFGAKESITLENGKILKSSCSPHYPVVYTNVYKYNKWIQNAAESKIPKRLCKNFKKFSKYCALF